MYKEILENYKNFLLARNQSLVYYNYIRIFLKFIEKQGIVIENINQDTITTLFNEKHYKPNSKNNFIKSGKSFYEFMGIKDSEWTKIKTMKTERKIPQFLSEKDLAEGLKQLGTYNYSLMHPIKLEALLYFMFYTGLRKSEITGIKRANINLEEKKLIIRVPNKGKKERIVYLTTKLKNILEKYFLLEPEIENALNINKTKLEYICVLLTKYLKRNVTVHLFRHSFARHLVMKGVSIGIISKLLGHSSINTTSLYTEPDEGMIKDMFNSKLGE